jgi:hypothetical protein
MELMPLAALKLFGQELSSISSGQRFTSWTADSPRRYNRPEHRHGGTAVKQLFKFSILAGGGASAGALLGYLGQCVGSS